MSGVPAAMPCTVCGEHTHLAGRCSALRSPLGEGFYSGGGGGGGGHSHDDDDDEAATLERNQKYAAVSRDEHTLQSKPLHPTNGHKHSHRRRTP